jgi:hypothetical protein
MADEPTYGEKQILTTLIDVKGQLNGIANQQAGIGRKYDQIIERLVNLEEEWRLFRIAFQVGQIAQEVASRTDTVPTTSPTIPPPHAE